MNYTLSFNEKLNIKLIDNPNDNENNNEDIFSIKVFPSNKNITLIDPSDNILVDTNFDENLKQMFLVIQQMKLFLNKIQMKIVQLIMDFMLVK